MKPNGRRAWRRFAKQQRRKVNRRNRQTGTPWINDADGAFYRHEQKHFEQRPIVPVGPFTARSLVGMTMGARKRAWEMMGYLRSDLRIGERLRPCHGCTACNNTMSCCGCRHGYEPWDNRYAHHICDPEGPCDGSGVLPARKQK